MDDFTKYLITLVICGTIYMCVEKYIDHIENIKAMETGHIQVIENDKVLWKKEMK